MKILHVVPSFGLGGMEKVLCSIVNGISQDVFHEILALDNEMGARHWIENEAVRFLSFKKASTRFQFFRNLYKTIKESDPNILMTYNWGATDAIWLGRLAGISTIYHSEHGFNVDEAQKRQWKRNIVRTVVYRLVKRVIVVSNELREMLKQCYWLADDQVEFIPNGINCEYFIGNAEVRQQIRTKLGVKNNEVLLGYLGRLDPVKNFDLLLDGFELCVKEDPAFKLMLIGDGPQKNHIKALCRKKNLERKVLLVGKQKDVLPFIRALDVFVLTSFREQMPMSLLEAMAVSIPVVAVAVGDITKLVEQEKQGLLLPLDVENAAEVMASCFHQLREARKRQTMGRAARQKIISTYQERDMLHDYARLLQAEE
ncbi:MAG: glycosyltransferase [Saprospiraceae bacterium]|nr:glycosyltransferase [Nitrospira sp.]